MQGIIPCGLYYTTCLVSVSLSSQAPIRSLGEHWYGALVAGVGVSDRDGLILIAEVPDDTLGQNIEQLACEKLQKSCKISFYF